LSAKGVFKRNDVHYNPGPYPPVDIAELLKVHDYNYVMDPTRSFDFVSGNILTVSIAKSAVQCCLDAAEVQHYEYYGYDSEIEYEDEDKKNEVITHEGTRIITKVIKIKSDLKFNQITNAILASMNPGKYDKMKVISWRKIE